MTIARARMFRAPSSINSIAVGIIMIAAVLGSVPLTARHAGEAMLSAIAAPAVRGADHDAGAQRTDATIGEDEAQLVPAVFAWDPDVAYVFQRHVSKWM